MLSLVVAATVVGFLSFLPLSLASAQPIHPPAPGTSPPAASDATAQPFVIEYLSQRIRFEADGTGERRQMFRVKILSEAGVQGWGQLDFAYSSAFESLEVDRVEVLKAAGDVIRPTQEAVQDVSGLPSPGGLPVFTDIKQKRVTVPSLRPGDTLTASVTVRVHAAAAPGHFWFTHDFDRANAVLDEVLEVDVPAERAVIVRTRDGINQPDVVDLDRGRRRLYRWRSSNTPAASAPSAPLHIWKRQPAAAVHVTTFQSWHEVAAWYDALLRPRISTDASIRRKAEELTRGLTTAGEKIRAIHNFVSREVRYVSLSFGTGRYAPHEATEVLRTLYGDCKDKHALTAALLGALGIRASAVLASVATELRTDAPSPGQFDHLLTVVPSGADRAAWLWFDTTNDLAPAGYLVPSVRGKEVLLVGESVAGVTRAAATDSPLVLAPERLPFETMASVQVDGAVDAIGTLRSRITQTVRGDGEVLIRAAIRAVAESQRAEFLKLVAGTAKFVGDVSDLAIQNEHEVDNPLVFQFTSRRAGFLNWASAKSTLSELLPALQLPAATRNDWIGGNPVALGVPASGRLRVAIDLPDGYAARAPADLNLSRDYGSYSTRYEVQDRRLVLTRTWALNAESLPADRGADWLSFVAAIRDDEARTIPVEGRVPEGTPTAPPDARAAELYWAATAAYEKGKYSSAIDLYQKVVDVEPTHDQAWYALGLSARQGKRTADAVKAFLRQIALNPFHKEAHRELGHALRDQKDDAGAIAAYRDHVKIQPLDGLAFYELGKALVRQGNETDALAVLEQAQSLLPEHAELRLEMGRIYLTRGRPDDAVRALSSAIEVRNDAWALTTAALNLANREVRLDLGRSWAELAVQKATADVMRLTVERLDSTRLVTLDMLAWSWDALGWVLFKRGDVAAARPYLQAAAYLSLLPNMAEHLGQACEKLDDRLCADRAFVNAAFGRNTTPAERERLQRLAGPAADVSSLVQTGWAAAMQERSVLVQMADIPEAGPGFIAVETDRSGVVINARFFGGDERVKPVLASLKGRTVPVRLPESVFRPTIFPVMVYCHPAGKGCMVTAAAPWQVRQQERTTNSAMER